MKCLVATSFLLLLCSVTGVCQPGCTVVHYTTDDGLSDNRIMCITKDQEGFMWFGTWAGLNRFDGRRFVSYKTTPHAKTALKNNRIDKIIDDTKGHLWLKSNDGFIYLFNKKTESFLALEDFLPPMSNGQRREFHYIINGRNGDAWLLTKNHGVFRVAASGAEGIAWQQFSADANGNGNIPSNQILFFEKDKLGRYWLGTDKGMALLTPQENGVYRQMPPPAVPVPGPLTHIAIQGEYLWLSDNQGNLLHYSYATQRFTACKVNDTGLKGLYISLQEHAVYGIAVANVLKRFDWVTGTTATFLMPGSNQFHAITGDSRGNIWIEPEESGIIQFDPVKKTFRKFLLKASDNIAGLFRGFETLEDAKGRFWALMKGSGLGYYDTAAHAITYFHNNPADQTRLFPNSVRVIFYDEDGVMWLATAEDGVYRLILHENDFEQHQLEASPERTFNEVKGLCADYLNRIWMATRAGNIYVIKDGKKVSVTLRNMPEGGLGQVQRIYEDRQHHMWLGTRNNGLFRASPLNAAGTSYRLQHFKPGDGDSAISSAKVYSILQDQQNRIWVGTLENGINLMRENKGRVAFIHRGNGLKNYPLDGFGKVRHMALDTAGRLWIGTTDGLLIMNGRHDSAVFKRYVEVPGNESSLSNNDIQYIYKDGRHQMWLATSGGGINKAISGNHEAELTFHSYSIKDGLQTDLVVSCVADKENHLWLGTPHGLSKFDGTRFRNYNSYDGITARSFSEAAAIHLGNGKLVFGSVNGYLLFSPQLVKDHKVAARLAFTNLQINNADIHVGDSTGILPQSVNTIKEITLTHKDNIITIDYGILDYRFQDEGLWACRLSGFDEEWYTNNSHSRTTYTNLPPGNYVFEIKNLSQERYTNIAVKQLHFCILPPPWKTWWAYLIYLVFTVAVIIVIARTAKTMLKLRQRIAVEHRITTLKQRFFTNISHELKTPLSLIQGPAEAIARTEHLSADGRSHIEVLIKNSRRMYRFINQLLELGKVDNNKTTLWISEVETVQLAKQVAEYFVDALKEKNVQVVFKVHTSNTQAWLDAEKIETVLYNLMANAVKYSPVNSTITVYCKDADAPFDMAIEVCDEGPGVEENDLENIFQLYYEAPKHKQQLLKGTGIGLSLSKALVELHHGVIYARNNTAKGLTVAVLLKRDKAHFTDAAIVL